VHWAADDHSPTAQTDGDLGDTLGGCGQRDQPSPAACNGYAATCRFGGVRRKREDKATLLDPDLFKARLFKFGVSGQLLQQIALGGTTSRQPRGTRSSRSTLRRDTSPFR